MPVNGRITRYSALVKSGNAGTGFSTHYLSDEETVGRAQPVCVEHIQRYDDAGAGTPC